MPADPSRTVGTSAFGLTLSAIVGIVLGAGAVAYFAGTIEVVNTVQYVSSATGASVQIGSGLNLIYNARMPIVEPCSSTGGSPNYFSCKIDTPFTNTGFVLRILYQNKTLHRGRTFFDLVLSGTGTDSTGTNGSGLTVLMNNVVVGTGEYLLYGSGARLHGGGDIRLVTSSTIAESVNAHTGLMKVWIEDDFSE